MEYKVRLSVHYHVNKWLSSGAILTGHRERLVLIRGAEVGVAWVTENSFHVYHFPHVPKAQREGLP